MNISVVCNLAAGLVPTLWAKFSAGSQFTAAFNAMRAALQLAAALGAELGFAGLGRAAVGAGGGDRLAPIAADGAFVIIGHSGVFPGGVNCFARLRGGHGDAQVGGALFTEATLIIPTTFAADPGGAVGTLREQGAYFFRRFAEGFVVRAFPGGRTGAFGEVGGAAKQAAKDAVGGVHEGGDCAQGVGPKAGAVSVAAAVTVELKLKTFVGTLISIVACEFDGIFAHSFLHLVY